MFTNTFTLDRHIEELRAELRGAIDIQEAEAIRAELEAQLLVRDALHLEMSAAI